VATIVKPQPKITERTLLVDESKAIERVKQWGHMVMPVMVFDRWHKQVPSEVHYWEQNKEYKKILKHANAFNPHEEIDAQVELIIRRLAKEASERKEAERQKRQAAKNEIQNKVVNTIKGSPYNLKIRDHHYSANDFTMHLEVLSEKYFGVVENSFVNDDVVQCGLDIYNGIETSTALGGTMYTYRLKCLNGAVARDKALGTFSIPGVAKAEERLVRMETGILDILERFTKVIDYYTRAAQIKVNLKIANEYYLKLSAKQIADEHMPESFEIDQDFRSKLARFKKSNEHMDLAEILNLGIKDPKKAPVPVTKVYDNPSLWYIFNETTAKVNRKHESKYETGKLEGRPKLSFSILGHNTNAAHKELFAIVNRGQANE
jgi:hypothetical protein